MKTILIFSIIGSINCFFKVGLGIDLTNLPPVYSGVLDEKNFNFSYSSATISPYNSFPDTIKINAILFEEPLDITLFNKGLRDSFSIESNVFTSNSNEASSKNTTFQLYSDDEQTYYATLILNNDLDDYTSFKPDQKHRIFFSMIFNGVQIDIQPIFIFNNQGNRQINYNHIYRVQNNFVSNDQGRYTDQNINDPCDSNPCQNDGTCSLGYGDKISCSCPESYKGTFCETIYDPNSECSSCFGLATIFPGNPSPDNPCAPSPCENKGICVRKKPHDYICFCSSKYTGRNCTTLKNSPSIGKGYENYQSVDVLRKKLNDHISNLQSSRSKRATSNEKNDTFVNNNLFVELLVVVDSTVYSLFQRDFPDFSESAIEEYIKLFFCHVINGINQRFKKLLQNDLMITASLSNVLILNDPKETPWTNSSIVKVPDFPLHKDKPTALANLTVNEFANKMKSSNRRLTYDYAVAVMDLDIWLDNKNDSKSRGVIGYTQEIGGICSNTRYSVIEWRGFQQIFNLAHELGHSLGADHDGTKDATSCKSSSYIMAPTAGSGQDPNATAYLSFSDCSINAFKKKLLTSDGKNISPDAACLKNKPETQIEKLIEQSANQLPGTVYDADQQCRLAYGNFSVCCNNNTKTICITIYCKANPNTTECTAGGVAVSGWGALDGTKCIADGNNGVKNIILYNKPF